MIPGPTKISIDDGREFPLISIDGEELGWQLGKAVIMPIIEPKAPARLQSYVLDFETGDQMPADTIDKVLIGNGRPGVKGGKRFIRIPAVAELYESHLATEALKVMEDLRKAGGQLPVIGESKLDKSRSGPPDLRGTIAEFTAHGPAQESIALAWIKSLQPECFILYYVAIDTDEFEPKYCYSPVLRLWKSGKVENGQFFSGRLW